MRKAFSKWIETQGAQDPDLLFLTGDLGFAALENVAQKLGPRFINVGVAEQNMVSVAAGLAQEGFKVICYSIAPFAVFRPAEQIRLDICVHNKNVKIVGNGGGYGYGIMGATHHAIEDIAVLSSFENMRCLLPQSTEDVAEACRQMLAHEGPCYLRLNSGSEEDRVRRQPFAPVRLLNSPQGDPQIVIAALGPMALHAMRAIDALESSVAVYSISEMPLRGLTNELKNHLRKCETLWVLEEHVARGGLAEHLTWHSARAGIPIRNFKHNFAAGYPTGLYGSQAYHQGLSGLSVEQIRQELKELL